MDEASTQHFPRSPLTWLTHSLVSECVTLMFSTVLKRQKEKIYWHWKLVLNLLFCVINRSYSRQYTRGNKGKTWPVPPDLQESPRYQLLLQVQPELLVWLEWFECQNVQLIQESIAMIFIIPNCHIFKHICSFPTKLSPFKSVGGMFSTKVGDLIVVVSRKSNWKLLSLTCSPGHIF